MTKVCGYRAHAIRYMCGACANVACYMMTLYVVHVCLPIKEILGGGNVNVRDLLSESRNGRACITERTRWQDNTQLPSSLHNTTCDTLSHHPTNHLVVYSTICCCLNERGILGKEEWWSAKGGQVTYLSKAKLTESKPGVSENPIPIHPSAGPNIAKLMLLPFTLQYTVQLVPRNV